VHDFGRRDPDDIARQSWVGHVARMPAQKVVGHAAPDRIELDPLPNDVAARRDLIPIKRQHLRRQHLQLERDRETVLRPARAKPEEHFAGDKHLARRTPL